jgi:hypothetical protein
MPDRYTRRDVEELTLRLALATGNRIADADWKITDRRREGAWFIDHNSVYGGYVIAAYVASSPPREGDDRPQSYTAQTHPLGDARRSAREFCEAAHFALRALGAQKRRRRA